MIFFASIVALLLSFACAQETAFVYTVIAGSCDRTCGHLGTFPSLVACVDSRTGGSVNTASCGDQVAPPTPPRQACRRRSCPGNWNISDFGPCSATCEGVQVRSVDCVQDVVSADGNSATLGVIVNDSVCTDAGLFKPLTTLACGESTCFTYQWSTGDYGACSSRCGPGSQSRPVVCQSVATDGTTAAVSDRECEEDDRPEADRACDVDCRFVIGNWTDCVFPGGYRCGDNGFQTRTVTCLNADENRLVDLSSCEDDPTIVVEGGGTPAGRRLCDVECVCENPSWVTGAYSACSLTCGNGTRTRDVLCRCPLGPVDAVVNDTECSSKLAAERPAEQDMCGDRCPCTMTRWEASEFSNCSQECAGGIQTRRVWCACQRGNESDVMEPDLTCRNDLAAPKPSDTQDCNVQDCPCTNPQWDFSRFSECTRPCGGTQTRTVSCTCPIETNQGLFRRIVNDSICQDQLVQARPESERDCPTECCYASFPTSPWSACSVTCGDGTQTRSVSCGARVCPSGEFVGEVADGECTNRGIDLGSARVRVCSAPVREGSAVWEASEWTACSNTCGGGVKYRKVECVDKCSGKRRSKKKCRAFYASPSTIQACKCIPCDPNNCHNNGIMNCGLVQQLGLCRSRCEYQRRCCKSCYNDIITEP